MTEVIYFESKGSPKQVIEEIIYSAYSHTASNVQFMIYIQNKYKNIKKNVVYAINFPKHEFMKQKL